jgi:hypothetical protein
MVQLFLVQNNFLENIDKFLSLSSKKKFTPNIFKIQYFFSNFHKMTAILGLRKIIYEVC